MAKFDTVWKELLTYLKPGAEIRIWNIYNGYLGENLTVTEVDPDYISIDPPRVWDRQDIPKVDFERVWFIWQDYRALRLERGEFRDLTKYFKYIVSVLRWYESESQP